MKSGSVADHRLIDKNPEWNRKAELLNSVPGVGPVLITDDAVLRPGILELDTHSLQKPFSLGTLADKVRDSLGRPETVQ
jgi:hypothetical protein